MLFLIFFTCLGVTLASPAPPAFSSFLGHGFWQLGGKNGMNLTIASDLTTATTFAGVFKGGLVDFAFFVANGTTSFMAVGPQVWPKANCRSEEKNVFELFSLNFVAGSQYRGPVFYSGKPANLFLNKMDKCYGLEIPMYNCTAKTFVNGGSVLGVQVSGVFSGMPTTWSITFDSWVANASIPAPLTEVPAVCVLGSSSGSQTCPLSPVQSFHTFKNQPGTDTIANENTADDLGEVAWLCMHGPKYPNNPFVSRYSVTANTTWSLYAQCNEGLCMEQSPPVSNTPGRQCPGCNDPNSGLGQCAANSDTGSWLSWPREHQCGPGEVPGAGCGWSYGGSDRTIEVSCLADRGLFALCGNLTKAAVVFNKAFDPETGCPNVSE
jgi:hypothetical protein